MSITLANPFDCQGEVLTFRYNRGSNPGSYRLVYVLGYKGIGNRTLQCWDFDREAPRCFCQNEMAYIVKLETSVKKVNLANLPDDLADGDDIAERFQKEGYDTYNDDNVVVAVKRQPPIKVERTDQCSTLRIHGKGGLLALEMIDDVENPLLEVITPKGNRVVCLRHPTVENLRDALDRILNG